MVLLNLRYFNVLKSEYTVEDNRHFFKLPELISLYYYGASQPGLIKILQYERMQ